MSILLKARRDIVAILKNVQIKAELIDIIFPPDAKLGDLSFSLFAEAKKRGIAPGALAQELAKKLKPAGLVDRVEIAGPYLNFWLKRNELIDAVLDTRQPSFRISKQQVMVEMISPNNNKPLHLGHLRNGFIGESVSRLLESQGAKVIRACLFNDRGLHIAKAMLAYKLWGKNKTPGSEGMKGDQFVVQWYVLFEQRVKKEIPGDPISGCPRLTQQAEELARKWEAGDKKTLILWNKISGWALTGINETLARLNLKFDVIYFESKLWKQGKKIVEQGLKRGIFKKDKTGAVIAEFSNLPPKVLLRADGTAIYATTDLYLTSEKFKKYKLARAIWCVGQEQDLYLKQLFTICRMFGYEWVDRCEHLSYQHVHLPEGRMKTREGTVVEADLFLDQMIAIAKREIKARHINLTKKELRDRAEIITQAAVRYFLLKVSPFSPVHFDPKASLSFTGDTGPYLLYTYARIASILRKVDSSQSSAHSKKGKTTSYILHTTYSCTATEWLLILQIARFSEIVAQAATGRDPSHLAKYLFELTQLFSNFYEKSPVLKAEESVRYFRLALISTFQKILKEGLRLLTIETLEEM